MLQRAGLSPEALACGVHEPMDTASARAMIRSGAAPTPLNHNCSGKHCAMLATAVHSDEPTDGYWRPDHPVQVRIARVLEDLTGCRLGPDVRGIDGCSVPNWAMPLSGLAQAFARFATGEGVDAARAAACRRIAAACWAHPDLVAGPGRLDTLVMQRLPGSVLMKSGAEGVYCGALPERGLGFALKIDDGAKRAAEAVAVEVISRLFPVVARRGPGPWSHQLARRGGRADSRDADSGARTRRSKLRALARSGGLAADGTGRLLLVPQNAQQFLYVAGERFCHDAWEPSANPLADALHFVLFFAVHVSHPCGG